MASSRACFSRFPLLRSSSLSSPLLFSTFSPSLSSPISTFRKFSRLSASLSTHDSSTHHSADQFPIPKTTKPIWKPICLYYTQGKCTLMNDPVHLDKFSHNCSIPLEANISTAEKLRPQNIDYLLVLDLEGKVEILEFPVMIMDAKTLNVVDFFHRFVRPTKMSEQRIKEYIEGKYGKLGVDRVWHDTAISFKEVIQEFEAWISGHNLWEKELGGPLTRAAFVTCGNWDIKTKIPEQCQVCDMQVPSYFMEWINLKDIYLNFYNSTAKGMRTMLDELKIPLSGRHHLGIDDTKNITRVVQRMLADGALMQITARRSPASPRSVDFLFKNRIR
ncbi:hypothetical protein SOVF_026750 isoform A [Spinacia oleracea]|uniref:Uncharacterized exonuclease domain-containing protein At3g15140 n=1 Tax=Spinacia oleracea TaxID=3562 RepID=A0A9R0I7A4_SPIOL|nr:uncharacterized exonuclease domain-containing protein At3g15140 [Spinacia oleracea]KNA23226.1 hypothetical protein SOVF_026750 isoform A [Spinacia oleracea]